MFRTLRLSVVVVIICCPQFVHGADSHEFHNLLRNPQFGCPAREQATDAVHHVPYWNTGHWGDITVVSDARKNAMRTTSPGNLVRIKAGQRFWQFAALPELGLANGDSVSLAVKGLQKDAHALHARLCLMLIESADGSWSPGEFGLHDQRTFARHGRGELVRSPQREAMSEDVSNEFLLKIEGLTIDARFKDGKESSAEFRNVVGVLVEFANVSARDVWIHSPTLVRGDRAVIDVESSRPMPDYYRRIPHTLQKLASGQPIHILALGSSIDRGSANPPLYWYEEDPASSKFKTPRCECRPSKPEDMAHGLTELAGRPDLCGYVGWWQHYFMYTGRLRLELMRQFHYPVNKILLNVMACDGSSIGESHSGFRQYATLDMLPDPNRNGHATGRSWAELYPALFQHGKTPAPDLVVFGHGHNEHIDHPDEIAAYEGAVRWFQRHYPNVEFVSCMWIRDKGSENSVSAPMRDLCRYYGIPFVDVGQMYQDLKRTCNMYAVAVDGGHPGEAGHYLWSKQLEQVFQIPPSPRPGVAQRRLPERMDPYSYGWEGDIKRFSATSPRIVKQRMMVIEDAAFNAWGDNKGQLMKLSIDGRPAVDAGHGRHSWSKPDPRNSTFVHGRLSLGDRHIIEIVDERARLVAVDCKVCPKRVFWDAASDRWQDAASVVPFDSVWGAPYGTKMFRLPPGGSVTIDVEATDLSVAYLDKPTGGTLHVEVDGRPTWSQPTNVPYQDATGTKWFLENRRGVTGMKHGRHRVSLRSEHGDVWILGLFTYDQRP